jgi:hypothetical protein
MDQKVIQSSRWKILVYLLGCLTFLFLSWGLFQDTPRGDAWKLWPGVIFFGFGSLALLVLLLRPQRLVLDETGFSLEGGLVVSPRKVRWSDVDKFYVWGGNSVGYKYRPDATNVPKIVKVNRAFDADGTLPRAWPVAPDELVAELNTYRERASTRWPQVGTSE